MTPHNIRLLQCAQPWLRPVCLYEVIALGQSEAQKAPRYAARRARVLEVTIGHRPLQRRVTVGHFTYIHLVLTISPLQRLITKGSNNAEDINVNKYTNSDIFKLNR